MASSQDLHTQATQEQDSVDRLQGDIDREQQTIDQLTDDIRVPDNRKLRVIGSNRHNTLRLRSDSLSKLLMPSARSSRT